MATIGTGRDDPRRWVKAAYHLTDSIERGKQVRRASFPPAPR